MTISTLLTNITDAITQISVTGVTIKDFDEVPTSLQGQANILFPSVGKPDFLTNFRMEYQSFIRGASSQVDLKYTLNYKFIGTTAGSMANFAKGYADMVGKVALIVNAMITATAPYSGRVDLELGPITFGAQNDPSGNSWHGADIALHITEMQNT